jgi:uncharacterized protein YhjY with autotransporter beta-barrel domain
LAAPAWAQECKLPDALWRQVVASVSRYYQIVGDVRAVSQVDVDRAVSQTADRVCAATKALGLPSGIAVIGATSLTGAILGRLDAVRADGGSSGSPVSVASSSVGVDGLMALGTTQKARPAPPRSAPFTVYAAGTFAGGDSSDMPDAAAFAYGGTSGMIGLEYSVNRNLILGLAGSFTTMDADVTTGATIDADVIHGAAYMSYATRQLFIDALAAYGAVNLDLARPGTSEVVHGSSDGGAFALAARGGYLLDFGKVRAGPIAGLTYVHARIDGYTETGADPSAMTVGDQTVESITGSAGIRFLAPFQAGGSLFVPYLNVTLEHQFGDGTSELTTSLTNAPPGSPVALSFPTFGARDYGKVEGGLTVELTPSASVNLSGASTFARDDGQDYRISAGLSYRF